MKNLTRRVIVLVIMTLMVMVLLPSQASYAKSRLKKSGTTYSSIATIKKNMDEGVDMRIDRPCGLSKKDFVKLLKNCKYDYKGFLEKNAEYIWKMEQKYQINGLFYCGIFALESGWGQCGYYHNYTGMIGCKFLTDKQGIKATFKNLAKNYIPNGRTTIKKVGYLYCDGYAWPGKVLACMKKVVYNK